ncbi:hypothetical protein ACLMJK_006983 [Lecanora helva]
MSASQTALRRALLYVPGSSQKMLKKVQELTADCIAYDLEDSVTPGRKEEARSNIRHSLEQSRPAGIRECAVRINAVASGFASNDLAAVVNAPNLDSIVVPKVNSPSDLHWVADFINHHRTYRSPRESGPRPIKILALIESAKAIANLHEICQTVRSQLDGLIFAAEDFALDLSLTRTPSLTEFLYARSAIVTACRAHELPSVIDLVCTEYKGKEGRRAMQDECHGGKRLGFNGKQCIHPDQVEIAHKLFAPSEKELAWAVRVVVADQKADTQGRGSWTLDGKMIDVPVVKKANSLVTKAEACGIKVDKIRAQWKDQEPE